MIYRQIRDMAGDFWVIWHPEEPEIRGVGLTEDEARKSLGFRETHLAQYGQIVISRLGKLLVTRDINDRVGKAGYGSTTELAVANLVGCTDPQIAFNFGSVSGWTASRGMTSASAVHPADALRQLQEALSERSDKEILSKIGLALGLGKPDHEAVEQYNQYLDRQDADTKLLIKFHNMLKSSTLHYEARTTLIEEIRKTIKRRNGIG